MPDAPTIRHIAAFLEAWAPPSSALSYDNVGLQVGDPDAAVRVALLGLDMTPELLDEAKELGAALIVTHHPLLFRPVRAVTTEAYVPNLVWRLAAENIALYSIHTNLDAASGGVSFALADQLGIEDAAFLQPAENGDTGFGAIGSLPAPVRLQAFLGVVAERLGAPALRYAGDPEALVRRVAVCGGSGSNLIDEAAARGADAYVTADIKYHDFFNALDAKGRPRLALIDAGHYETEKSAESLLLEALAKQFPQTAWKQTRASTSPARTFIAPGR